MEVRNMRRILIAGILLLVLAFAGCTGGGGETKAPAKEAAPEAQPPATEAPKEAPAEAEAKPALHGEGKCDQCHDAPTMEDMRTGLHKQAFEKFEGHKNFCQECHDVQKTCTQCHALPAVMQ
ncbi:MAG: hypothetical protein GXO66_01265 [Euryarchaeota archaeon]|nr:hypothetical protein [Euryarchaeota archaeon]